jgi:hypothetical protein
MLTHPEDGGRTFYRELIVTLIMKATRVTIVMLEAKIRSIHIKCLKFLSNFNQNGNMSIEFSKIHNINFLADPSGGNQWFHAERRTDKHGLNRHISQLLPRRRLKLVVTFYTDI